MRLAERKHIGSISADDQVCSAVYSSRKKNIVIRIRAQLYSRYEFDPFRFVSEISRNFGQENVSHISEFANAWVAQYAQVFFDNGIGDQMDGPILPNRLQDSRWETRR